MDLQLICVCFTIFWLNSLVEVHSQTAPYVSFSGQTLANNFYVDISEIGNADSGSDSVQCITDLATCCSGTQGQHRGDWYFPDGTRLPFNTPGVNIFEVRVAQRVDLRRRNNANSPTGIYRCDIPTNAVHHATDISVRDTVYVGLYTGSGGTLMISSIVTDQLTLTCISTGGPATTVTWTRGFTNVTQGSVTMLSNMATAMYIHTLTLTERHGGVYTCSVSNRKPSTASADITLVVAGQPNITMLHELATSISLSWTSAGSEGVMYEVNWQRNTSVGCGDEDTDNTTITGGSMTSYTITGLEEDSRYAVTVTAFNTSGDRVSNTVTAVTEEAAPTAPPSEVDVADMTSSTITVQWGEVPCIHQNGAITGYSVQYGVMGSGNTEMLTVDGATVMEATIQSLNASTTYNVQVAAVNSADTGVFSDSQSAMTLGAVPVLTVPSTTATSISLSWTSAGSEGVMYEVNWQRNTSVGCADEDTDSTTINGGSMTNYTITGLEEDSRYAVTVTASRDETSNEITAMTMMARPTAAPMSVTPSSTSSSTITVVWGEVPCADQNGAITGYSVRYGVIGNGNTQTMTVDEAETTIETLTSSTTYSIQVAAVNSAGTGVYSDPRNQLTRVEAPVVTVDESSVTATSIPVSWSSGGSEGVSYVVEWEYGGECPDISGGSQSVSVGGGREYTIEGLEEYITYSITVRASNSLGSVDSTAVNGRTSEATPSDPPSSITFDSTPLTITAYWGEVDYCHRNGEITCYTVQAMRNGEVVGTKNVASDVREANVSGLSPSTEYILQVAAVNTAGIGVYSNMSVSTDDAFTSVVVTATTSRTVNISLMLVGGITVDSYVIHYFNTRNITCFNSSGEMHARTNVEEYTLMNLQEDAQYSITVDASLSDGVIAEEETTATTMTAVPSAAPSSLTVTGLTSSNITVVWGEVPCIHQNGAITGYSVRYGVMGSGNTENMTVDGATVNETTISGLNRSTNYSIKVAAVNSDGTGVYSSPIFIEIPQGVFLSLSGEIIPDHGYVDISDIGSTNDTALLCITDLPPPSGSTISGGNWFAPNGTRVGDIGTTDVPGFVRNRGSMVVRLLKRESGTPTEGIYHCSIQGSKPTFQTVNVGLYNSEGGSVTLSGGVNFTMDSDSHFTLTCISTGGPVTTVTWTRDSTTVTQGTQTVLNDPVTANYTHTLTVTGRLGGLYNCTVANSKPSTVSAELKVQAPSSEFNPRVKTSGNILTTTWAADTENNVTEYLIYYHHRNGDISVRNISGTETSHTFTEGTGERVYTVSVQALSVHLPSSIAGPVTARDPEGVGPISVAVMDDKLSISWGATPEPNDFCCWNYTVTVSDSVTGREVFSDVLNETQLSARGLVLAKGVSYNVSVFVTNRRGNSVIRSKVLFMAKEGSSSSAAGPAVAGVIVPAVVVAISIILVIIFIRWRRTRRGTATVTKPRPPPPPKKPLRKEEEEELEMEEIVEHSEDETDSEDSYVDVSFHSDIPEAEFPEYVRLMHEDRDHRLELEYRSLDKLPQPPSDAARLPCNIGHNRFKNIFPYDHSRVHLKGDRAEEGSDYINASFIDGYPDKKNAYIASQGPTGVTVNRFWEMVWENRVHTIVMLTRCIEDGKEKCEQYWPQQTNNTETRGEFHITVTSFVPSAEYQIRKIHLQSTADEEGELTVTHMFYTAWPDHGVPRNAMSLISFIRYVRKEHPASLTTPLLVHCSAGVGRTGTFILLDLAMQQMRREGTLGVFQHLKSMRSQRIKMVQTQAQYVFIHDSLSELVVCGETEVAAGDLRIKMNRLHRPVPGDPSGLTGFQTQFQVLEHMSSQYKASYLEAEAKYNSAKNRFPDKLPNELGRVRLRHGPLPGSDYINASFIDGYKQRKAYIATQGPLTETVADFWRMVWEHNCSCIVMLCQTLENGLESSRCFWPEEQGKEEEEGEEGGREELYGKVKVGVKRESFHGDIVERRLEVEEESEGRTVAVTRTVTLLQLTSWGPGELPHPTAILSLVDLLNKAQRTCPSRHTVIVCSDGVGRTGTFICLHSQLERLKTEGVVDFFQAVKSARIQRAGLVPDAAHFAFCHDVAANYLDSFETYANFKDVV